MPGVPPGVVVPGVVEPGVVEPGGVVQWEVVIVSVSSVTPPLRASTRPSTVTPVVTVMLVSARIVPMNVDPVPSVAELPTCQYTLQACAPLIRLTWLPEADVNAEPIWNTNTEFGSPCAFSVSAPVSPIEDAELYTPG